MDGPRYSIGELAELTGVSRRTVHFYVQRRLIDPPLGLGRGRHYDERHVRQVLEVRALQGMGVPLADMQRAPGQGGATVASARENPAAPERAPVAASPAAPAAPGQIAPGLPSVTPSIMSVVRVRLAENVTLELSPGAPAPTPALVAELAAAVAGVLEEHAAGERGRGGGAPHDGAAPAQETAGSPARGRADGDGRAHQEEDPEEES